MIEVLDCAQGSDEWRIARMGIPTASEFSCLLAKGKDGGVSKTRKTYLYKLLGELLTGDPMWNYSNEHMERGKEQEDDARQMYALIEDVEPQPVGFIRNGRKGCSPDSLVGENGMLEIKTMLAHLLVELKLADHFPLEHKAQVQGQLWIAEREFCDFVAYTPKIKPYITRVYRDEIYIKALATAVDVFNAELDTMHAILTGKPLRAVA